MLSHTVTSIYPVRSSKRSATIDRASR